jgi:hypothetical protein
MKVVLAIMSCSLSLLIFSYLFYWLNCSKLGLFKQIQSKTDTLNKKKKDEFKLIIFISTFIVMFFLLVINVNDIIIGFIIGIIISFRDICFRNTFIEILKNEQ